MATPTYNPYQELGPSLFTDGLDYVIANIPGSPTYDDIINTIMAYWAQTTDPPGDDILGFIQSSMSASANDYINSQVAQNLNANESQLDLINSLICGITENSIESLTNYWDAANEAVALSGIGNSNKSAIWQALAIANAANTYWDGIVTTPGSWSTYINSNAAINYANISTWVLAGFVGTLSGFSYVQQLNVGGADAFKDQGIQTAGIVAVTGAIAVSCGKIMLKWAKRPC